MNTQLFRDFNYICLGLGFQPLNTCELWIHSSIFSTIPVNFYKIKSKSMLKVMRSNKHTFIQLDPP